MSRATGPQVPTGILLAAGAGTRFDPAGRRMKLLEPLANGPHAGLPVAVAAARNLRAVLPRVVAVVRAAGEAGAPDAVERLRVLLADAGCITVDCARAAEGMGASLACGVGASEDASGWIVALADMPAVLPSTIAAVAAALGRPEAIAAPCHRGRRGHPVGFGAQWRPALLALGGDQGARELLLANAPALIEVDDPGCLLDIDTAADLRR